MKRGDLVIISARGDFGKPRPALVIQSDRFSAHNSVIVFLLYGFDSHQPLCRVDVLPDKLNGLKKPSQIAIDKPVALRREKVSKVIGRVSEEVLQQVGQLVPLWFGLK